MDSLKDTIRDMQEIIQHLEAENKELVGALNSLANEAQGFKSLANIQDHGHTNMQCLEDRIIVAKAIVEKHSTNTAQSKEGLNG